MKEDYRIVILRTYEEKKEAGELSINLTHPTCANIRNEILSRVRTGCSKADLRLLYEFVEPKDDQQSYDRVIKRCDPDKFKALINFLNRGTKTHEKNVELLAFLIDFHCRPSIRYYRGPALKNFYNDFSMSGTREQTARPSHIHLPAEIQELALDLPTGVTQTDSVSRNTNSKVDEQGRGFDSTSQEKYHPQRGFYELTHLFDKGKVEKEITIEYPSGARVSIDASDLGLIAQLIRL